MPSLSGYPIVDGMCVFLAVASAVAGILLRRKGARR